MATLFEFKECPLCHCEETVMQRAAAKEPTLPTGAVVALQSVFTPLQDITKLTTLMVRGVVSHYDICAGCGLQRVVRVDETSFPTSALGIPTGIPKRK
jgi:hypothetical protein